MGACNSRQLSALVTSIENILTLLNTIATDLKAVTAALQPVVEAVEGTASKSTRPAIVSQSTTAPVTRSQTVQSTSSS